MEVNHLNEADGTSSHIEKSMYREIFNKSPDPIMLLEVIGGIPTRYLDVNTAYIQQTGYSKEEFERLNPYALVPEGFKQRIPQILEKLYKEKSMSIEYFRIARDSTHIPVEATMHLFPGEGRDVILVISRDLTERKRAENAIKASEEKYQTLFNKASDAIFLVQRVGSQPGYILEVNDIALERYGYSREEFLKFKPLDVSTENFDPPLPEILKTLDEIGSVTFLAEHLKKNGDIIPVEVNTHAFIMEEQPVFLSIARDITQRKQAKQVLNEKEAQLEAVLDSFPDHIWLLDNQLRILYSNNPGPTQTLESIMGKLIFTFMPTKKQQDKVKRHLEKALASTTPYKFEVKFQSPDGPVHYFENIAVPMRIDGKVVGLTISSRDITARIQAENRIKQSEKKFRSVINESRDGVMLTDEKGHLIDWNSEMEMITGISAEQVLGKDIWYAQDLLLPDYLKTPDLTKMRRARFEAVLISGEISRNTLEYEIVHFLDASRPRYVQANMFPIKTEKGWMIGGIWRDVTSDKHYEEKMKQRVLRFELEDQSVYLSTEADSILAREAFRDLLGVGYTGIIMSRTPEPEYREFFEEKFEFVWLAEKSLEEDYSSLFEKIESIFDRAKRRTVTLLDRVDYIISTHGFQDTLLFVYRLRELAILYGHIILLSIDRETVSERQLALLQKETKDIRPRILATLPPDLFEIIRLVYQKNNRGIQPSYKQLVDELNISRPTAKKRVRQLTASGYLQENRKGRQKVLELTPRGVKIFLHE